ncbi:hypothetical protein CPJCM30710_06800 [Clostridium polyendosporum]|uniref:ATP-grasp domain-containing protein n=1 Tax=Clostridium polyendosporum TaxID=69208 RepID=A0A919RXC2_9CLOT|nr:YheC/YheD family protein [Clostridium polyendosporum]GIM28014.1 hypothetical protein CPJCM30710_06800 [Clostridium polyendosporum]
MKLTIITDGSPEGVKIENLLKDEGISSKLYSSYQIRWGNWIDQGDKVTTFNSCTAIKNTSDKEQVILILGKNHINCPRRIKPGKKTIFPIIGRMFEHSNGGTDIIVIDSISEYKKSDREYFVEYIKLEEEYRIHVMDGKVFFIEEKYLPKKIHLKKYYKVKRISPSKLKKISFNARKDELFKEQIYCSDDLDEFENQSDIIIRSKEFGWRLRRTDLNYLSSNEKDKLVTIAIKSVYALGLDFGVVTIGKSLDGKFYALDVDASCKYMSKNCLDAYVKEFSNLLLKYDNLMNRKINVTIGADPECMLKDKDTNSLIYASDFFGKKGLYGLDDRSIESGKRCYPLVELRPQYSTNPRDVVESIKYILKMIGETIDYKNIGLYAGSMPLLDYWVGGHIHFGIQPNYKLIRALDNYLALPVMMIENSYSSRKRRIKYGALGNYRLKSYGGFEYCTLSSWLINPEITTGILCLAKVIAQEYLNLNEEFICNYSDIRAFYQVNKNYFKDKVGKILKNISETHTFIQYSKELRPLFKRIMECKEWDETTDLKENWSIPSSNEVYKQTLRCFIPKKKREELNIKQGSTITIMIGRNKYMVKVYPKDDFSPEKDSLVSFSEDICKEIGIKGDDCVGLWFDDKDKIFRAGPILGILSYREEDPLGPFARQTSLFKKLIKLSKYKGIITYVFTIWDADWKNHQVKGYTYDFEKEKWIKRYFKIPNVIYDRGDVYTEEHYGKYFTKYIDYTNKYDIKSINSLDCINLTNDKWNIHCLLESDERTKEYQIDTFLYEKDKLLKDCIDRYKHVFLKLRKGSRSKGIISVEKLDDRYCELTYKNLHDQTVKMKVNRAELTSAVTDLFDKFDCSPSDYIIQKAIPLSKYLGRKFEIRVVMQKNGEGFWLRTCMVARVSGKNKKFMTPYEEYDIKSSVVMSTCFGDNAEKIVEDIRKASRKVVELIDNKQIQAGEIAIDFAIDKDSNVFIIELNSKPDNLLSTIGAYKMRNTALYRLLEYVKFLAYK